MDNTERTAIIGTIRLAIRDARDAIERRETSLTVLRDLKERCDAQYLEADRLCAHDGDDPIAVSYRARLAFARHVLMAWIERGV